MLTYVWWGFIHAWGVGIPFPIAVLGNVVFGAGAVTLLLAATRALKNQIRV